LEPSDKSVKSPTPQNKTAKRKRGSNTEKPSKKKPVKQARLVNARRSVPQSESGTDDDEEEEEEEEQEENVSDDESSSQNNRGTRRRSRPPPRFIDIQESLFAGKTGTAKKQTRKSGGSRKGVPRNPPESFFVEDVEILKKP